MEENAQVYFSDYTADGYKLVWLFGWINGPDYIVDLKEVSTSCSIEGVNICTTPFISDDHPAYMNGTTWFRVAIAISVNHSIEPEEARVML